MTYFDSITLAAQRAQDWDVPLRLLPLTIAREAEERAIFDGDQRWSSGS